MQDLLGAAQGGHGGQGSGCPLAGGVEADLAVHVHVQLGFGLADGVGEGLLLPEQVHQEKRQLGDVLVMLRGGHVHDGLVLDLGHDLVPEVGLGDLGDVVRVGKDAVGGVQEGLQPVLVAECLFEIHCSHLAV